MRLPPCGSLTDRRVTGRRWLNDNGSRHSQVQVRPSTGGSIGSFVVDDGALHEDGLHAKLAALPQGTRRRAHWALALAHKSRGACSPPPGAERFPSARATRDIAKPRVPSVRRDEHILAPSRESGDAEPIRPQTSSASIERQISRVPRSSVVNGKRRLLVGRRAQTAQLLGLNSMRTLGAPMDATSEFTLASPVRDPFSWWSPAHITMHACTLQC